MKHRFPNGIQRHAGRFAAPPPRDPKAFWEDFRARAALAPQIAPSSRVRTGVSSWVWAAASALAAVAVGIGVWRGVMPPPLSPAILSLSAAENRSVFILRDEPTAAVIVWVADDGAAESGENQP